MKRRDFMRNAAMTAGGLTISSLKVGSGSAQKRNASSSKSMIHYEVHGNRTGKPLFLGFPMMASYAEIFGAANASVLSGYLDRLTDRYRVLLVDYPSIGKSGTTPAADLTADRVCDDLLGVADIAGFDRFAYWGYLWGAVVGLRLASRSKRVSALVCGGWPPLGAQYADQLRGVRRSLPNPSRGAMVVLREPSQYAQWITFYESMQDWPEAQAVARITCPRMVIFGANAEGLVAGIKIDTAGKIRERRQELERMGWRVTEIPGRDNSVMLDPATVVPVVREFLDKVQ